jgi:hypothetical protein
MSEEEERGFEVVDRRRVGREDETREAEAAPAPEGSEDTPESADVTADAGVDSMLGEVTVGAVLRMAANLLHESAWVCLGLTPDPITGTIRRNLPEARRAIDALSDLTKYVEMDASPSEKRELQVMLSNLRLNFVQQSSRAD